MERLRRCDRLKVVNAFKCKRAHINVYKTSFGFRYGIHFFYTHFPKLMQDLGYTPKLEMRASSISMMIQPWLSYPFRRSRE